MKKNSKIPALPSNKNFGFLFVFVFLICATHFYLINKLVYVTIFAVLTLLFLVLTIFTPRYLTFLNNAWFLLGIVLGKVVSPLVLGAIFFMIITPVAIISKVLGRDILWH